MNKRYLILGVCLMVVVLVALLISANRNASMVLVTEESPIATKQPISRPVVDFTKGRAIAAMMFMIPLSMNSYGPPCRLARRTLTAMIPTSRRCN